VRKEKAGDEWDGDDFPQMAQMEAADMRRFKTVETQR
jgi:hypothetical protein